MAEKKTTAKHYYWLKLKNSFFNQLEIKKLRKMAGGDTYTIIYLKLQLLSIQNGGYITFDHIENNFTDELALRLDESIDNVQATLVFLQTLGLIEETDMEDNFFLPAAAENIGSESESAERMRKHRETKKKKELKQLASQCDAGVTKMLQDSDADVTIYCKAPENECFFKKPSQCDAGVTNVLQKSDTDVTMWSKVPKNAGFLSLKNAASQCDKNVTLDIEKEIDIDIYKTYKTHDDDEEGEDARATPVDKNVDKSVDNFTEELLIALGKKRQPTQFELALVEKWVMDWGMGEHVIRFVLPRTVNADNPSFRYLDMILSDLYNRSIFTVDEAKVYYRQWDMNHQRNWVPQWG